LLPQLLQPQLPGSLGLLFLLASFRLLQLL
jgi:hypothetical protein